MVVGITKAVTIASRTPIAKRNQDDDAYRGQRKVEQKLVGLLVRGLAIVARNVRRDALWNQLAFQLMEALLDRLGDDNCIGAVAFGDGEAYGRSHSHSVGFVAEAPGAGLIFTRAQGNVRHVPQIDGASVGGADREKLKLRNRIKRAANRDGLNLVHAPQVACRERGVGAADSIDH